PKNIEGMSFENAFEAVKKRVQMVKENEDVQGIVVVYHGGFERDLDTGEPTEKLTGENLGYKMCHEIDGIDVLITGHQHRSIAAFCCGKCVTQTAFNAQELAYIEWDLDTNERSCQLIHADCEIDESLFDLFKEEEQATQLYLDQQLGMLSEGDLLIHNEFEARLHKHPLISFLNQVQIYCTHAQLAACALFNGACGFNQKITMRDLISTYPYPNTLVVLKISGKTLKEYLEKCAEYFEIIDGEIGINPRFIYPKPAHYNYDMVDGCDYTIQVSNPIGSRIIELKYDGKDVKEDDSFTLCVNNYRAACGGDFFMLKDCEIVMSLQDDMVECLSRYMKDFPVIHVEHKNNIKVIK
ncbi:MAG: bifunctional metallophosphatase/5'-nucleotidase, partial [Traorella sp.]